MRVLPNYGRLQGPQWSAAAVADVRTAMAAIGFFEEASQRRARLFSNIARPDTGAVARQCFTYGDGRSRKRPRVATAQVVTVHKIRHRPAATAG